jgi:hypothetical protein
LRERSLVERGTKKMTSNESKHGNKLYKEFTRADPHVSWFFQPHTILALLISGGLLIFFAFSRDETTATVSNTK